MKLSVQRLLTDNLTLELPRKEGEPNLVDITHGVDVRGALDTGDGTTLDQIHGQHLELARVRWHLGTSVLDLGTTSLAGIALDLHIPKDGPPSGEIRVERLHALSSDLEIDRDESRRAKCDRIAADGVRVHFTDDGVAVEVDAIELGIGLVALGEHDIAWRDVRIAKLRLSMPRGQQMTVSVGTLTIDGVAAVLDNILPASKKLTHEERIADAEEEIREARDPRELTDHTLAPDVDWRFLDALSGRIDVDLSLDVSVPVIKHFKGKNEFRIPVDAGVIDYKKTEHQLTTLVDTFIDVELEDDRLVLEKDIPLIPADEKIIVYWPLDAAEKMLASKDKIRLSTLMHAVKPGRAPSELEEQAEDAAEELADAEADKAEGRPVEQRAIRLLGLDLENVDVDLALGQAETRIGGGMVSIGSGVEAGGRLLVKGDFRYRSESAPTNPGELHLALKELVLSARDVHLNGTATLTGSLRGDIDDVVVKVGPSAPRTLALATESITLSDATIAFGKSAA